jgi:hypothetical protein
MNIIIKKDNFDFKNITFKQNYKNIKILYEINNLNTVGIPILIKSDNYEIKKIYDNQIINLKLLNKEDIDFFHKINVFLIGKYRIKNMINNEYIYLKQNDNGNMYGNQNYENNKDININISLIKNINRQNRVHLFII